MRNPNLRFLGLAIITLTAFSSKRCFAWGDEGHSVVALVAQEILSEQVNGDSAADKAWQSVQAILGETKIDAAATWPDEVKTQARECNGSSSKVNGESGVYVKDPNFGKDPHKGSSSAICDAYKYTAGWHFVNTAATSYAINTSDPNYFKGDAAVLVKGLGRVLKGEDANAAFAGVSSYFTWKKACLGKKTHNCKKEALEFLIHFVGDIHQPLHSGANCDLGGNDQYITFFGQVQDPGAFWCKPTDPPSCRNHELHQAWDTTLLVRSPGKPAFVSNQDYAAKLEKLMKDKTESADLSKCVKLAPGSPLSDDANGPVTWIDESLCYMPQVYTFPDDNAGAKMKIKTRRAVADDAENKVPNRCRADKAVGQGREAAFSAFSVGDKYYDTNIVTINERLYWAGVRLSLMLKDIYGTGDHAPDFDKP